jgi:hypothetical protein
MLIHAGEEILVPLRPAPSARGRDPELLARLAELADALFANRGRAGLKPAVQTAGERLVERYQALTRPRKLPFAGCKVACRYRCQVRGIGSDLAADPAVAAVAAAAYADDRADRFARVRTALRSEIRGISQAPESTLDALATCTFIHLGVRAELDDDDGRWAAEKYATQ